MNKIKPILSQTVWLELSQEKRVVLKKLFSIPRSGGVATNMGFEQGKLKGVVVSDGHSPTDLAAITVEKMQEFLGSKHTDFYELFEAVLEKLWPTFPAVIEKPHVVPVSEIDMRVEYKAPKKRGRPFKNITNKNITKINTSNTTNEAPKIQENQ